MIRLCDSAVEWQRSTASVATRDGRVEAEGVVGAVQVVVDRLRHTDDGEVLLGEEPRRDAERVLAADRDQRVDLLEGALDPLDAALVLERVRARRADDRAADVQDPGDLVPAERFEVAVDRTAPAVQDAERLVPVLPQPPADGADNRIQARAISAPSEHPHTHDA